VTHGNLYLKLCTKQNNWNSREFQWYLNKGRPTWWHLLYYVNLLLNMFLMLIYPSSGACDYLVRYFVGCILLTWGVLVLCNGWWCGIRVQAEPLLSGTVVVQPALGYHITNSQSCYITPTRLKSAQYSLHNNAPSSHKLLKMDVLTSETCWAVNWHNKASVIKLVYLYSNIKIMHGPIRISFSDTCFHVTVFALLWIHLSCFHFCYSL